MNSIEVELTEIDGITWREATGDKGAVRRNNDRRRHEWMLCETKTWMKCRRAERPDCLLGVNDTDDRSEWIRGCYNGKWMKHPALLPFSLNSMKLMELIEFHSTSINGRRGYCRNCEEWTVKGNARARGPRSQWDLLAQGTVTHFQFNCSIHAAALMRQWMALNES